MGLLHQVRRITGQSRKVGPAGDPFGREIAAMPEIVGIATVLLTNGCFQNPTDY